MSRFTQAHLHKATPDVLHGGEPMRLHTAAAVGVRFAAKDRGVVLASLTRVSAADVMQALVSGRPSLAR